MANIAKPNKHKIDFSKVDILHPIHKRGDDNRPRLEVCIVEKGTGTTRRAVIHRESCDNLDKGLVRLFCVPDHEAQDCHMGCKTQSPDWEDLCEVFPSSGGRKIQRSTNHQLILLLAKRFFEQINSEGGKAFKVGPVELPKAAKPAESAKPTEPTDSKTQS